MHTDACRHSRTDSASCALASGQRTFECSWHARARSELHACCAPLQAELRPHARDVEIVPPPQLAHAAMLADLPQLERMAQNPTHAPNTRHTHSTSPQFLLCVPPFHHVTLIRTASMMTPPSP
eukprot:4383786-Pleurochrysis_carterae.AAC.1